MEHIVATRRRLGPTRIGVEVGAEKGKARADVARAALAQHGAQVAFARKVAHGGARFVPRRQKLDETMGADEARAPRDQHTRHIAAFPVSIARAMLHVEPRFKVKGDLDADRRALEKGGNLDLAHKVL